MGFALQGFSLEGCEQGYDVDLHKPLRCKLGNPKASGWLGGPAVDQDPLSGKVLHYILSQGTHRHSKGHTDLNLPTFSVARSK